MKLLAIRFYLRFKMPFRPVQDKGPRMDRTLRLRDGKLVPIVCEVRRARDDVRSEQTHGRQFNDYSEDRNAYDMVTEENESPFQVPEFLTG